MEEKYMKSKKIIMITMCCLICVMAIGYAAFATNLTINGTANITSTWKVVFTKIEEVEKNGTASQIKTPTVEGTIATFDVDLKSPGDAIIYEITVANQGTLDAIINDITASETGSDAIKFEVLGIKKGDKLAKGTSTTFGVAILYDESITSQPTTTNNTLTVNINYVQDLGQTIESEDVVIKGPLIRINGDIDTIGTDIQIENEHFYVISSDSTNVTMFARYNLDIPDLSNVYKVYQGTGLQSEAVKGKIDGIIGYGTLAYSSSPYWSGSCSDDTCYVYNSNSYLYQYVETYKDYLIDLGVEIIDARLISYDELIALGCASNSSHTCKNAPSWVGSTSYWTGSTGNNNRTVSYVVDNGIFTGDSYSFSDRNAGVRPVITISKSELN